MPEATRRLPLPGPASAARSADPLPALALACLLPLLLGVANWLPIHALASFDTDNRAIVWIDGDAAASAAARRAVLTDPAFAGGATTDNAAVPAGCAHDATQLHFDVHRVDLAQPTRAALERLARSTGARVCATDRFELNVPVRADVEPWRWLRAEAWQALVLLVLPAGLVALAFAAPFGAPARARLRSEAPPAWQRPMIHAALAAIGVALVAAFATGGLVPAWQRDAITGVSPMFALHELVLLPLLHQLGFRTWLFAQLPPRQPLSLVVAISIAASVAAALPASLPDLAIAMLLTGACTALYLRTRTWLPAVALHAAAVAILDARLIAG